MGRETFKNFSGPTTIRITTHAPGLSDPYPFLGEKAPLQPASSEGMYVYINATL